MQKAYLSLRIYPPPGRCYKVGYTPPHMPAEQNCLTFAAFRPAKTHCRVISVGASFTATGACGREGRVAKHPWAYAPGPKPLKARTRKPYLVLGQRPRTQNCIAFFGCGGCGPGRELFDSSAKGRYGTICSKYVRNAVHGMGNL